MYNQLLTINIHRLKASRKQTYIVAKIFAPAAGIKSLYNNYYELLLVSSTDIIISQTSPNKYSYLLCFCSKTTASVLFL